MALIMNGMRPNELMVKKLGMFGRETAECRSLPSQLSSLPSPCAASPALLCRRSLTLR